MDRRPGAGSRKRRAALATATALLVLGIATSAGLRACRGRGEAGPSRTSAAGGRADARLDAPGSSGAEPSGATPGLPPSTDVLAPSPSTGWEEAAEAVTVDLRRLLDGRPRAGAYEEARAEAARQDLALFPPERERVRRLLLGSERERVLALTALAARPDADDDLVRIVLRSQRPEDDEVVRLLGAEVVQALPPDLLARHEDDLLRAFTPEANALVLAVALPALERMDEGRLRTLLRAQLAAADAEMLPVLLALSRARLGPAAMESVEASLTGTFRDRE